jgi:hypothetical protein
MAAAPLSMPHANPVIRIKIMPGMRFQENPRMSKIEAIRTIREINMRMGAGGIVASKYTPKGMPTKDPSSNQRKEYQSISFRTCGTKRKLARTSSTSTVGTTWAGGSTSDILVTATMANPKPLYPRMIPAPKTATIETINDPSSTLNPFKTLSPLVT